MNFDAVEDDGEQAGFTMGPEYEGGQQIGEEFFYSSRRTARVQTKDDQIYGIWAEEEERMNFETRGSGRMHANADSVLGGGAVQFVSAGVVEPSKDAPPKQEEGKIEQPTRAARKPVAKVIERDFGKFEQHTKGFGMKMLEKMGFKGRLGKNEDGMVNPIRVVPRKPGQALQETMRKDAEDMIEPEVVKKMVVEERFESREGNWKKGKKKEKTVYKTAAELLSREIALSTAPSVQQYTMIDHRQGIPKILSVGPGGETISTILEEQSWTPTANAHQLPELQHNLKLLVDMTEEDLLKIKREMEATEASFVTIQKTREKAEAHSKREQEAISRSEEALRLVDQCLKRDEQARANESPAGKRLILIADALDVIHHRYPNEWNRFGLANLAEPQAFPLMKAYLHYWEPLCDDATQDPKARDWMALLIRWRNILSDDVDVFRRMIDQTLVPIVHMCISSQWQPRDYASCIRLITQLQEILPEDLYHQTRQQAVLPRLKRTVEEWDPRKDAVPVNSWILPWRELSLEGELQPLYEIVQAKLSSVLREWHPSDGSAHAVIEPWKDYFLKQNFEALLARSILPKLHSVLRAEFTVNPAQQILGPFTWVMAWVNLIPSRVMIQLLRMEFFPKWFAALYAWAGSPNPNFDEMSQWYLGWRNQIPSVLRDTPDVKQILNRALDMMRLSLENPRGLPGLYAIVENELKNPPTLVVPPVVKPGAVEKVVRGSAPVDMSLSFKEIVQKCADMEGLEFVPNQRRGFVDGKQVFNFGKVAIYLDNRTIYAPGENGGWSPISLPDLIDKAR